jgi:hypothetical protein
MKEEIVLPTEQHLKESKICSNCDVCFPLSDFYQYVTSGNKITMAQCKNCIKDKARINARLYNLNNRKKKRLYEQKRYMSDANYKAKKTLRRKLLYVLFRKCKDTTCVDLTGLCREELILHIQSLFKNGMSWSNHGKWEIDHIVPCSKFDLSKKEEAKKCFYYTNIQPLWAYDNIKKSNNV